MKTLLHPAALYWASFYRFEFRIPGEAVNDICQPGASDEAVAFWAPKILARVQLDDFPRQPTADAIRAELAEYGAWDDDELADQDANWRRIVWSAAWNIADDENPDCSEPLKDWIEP